MKKSDIFPGMTTPVWEELLSLLETEAYSDVKIVVD